MVVTQSVCYFPCFMETKPWNFLSVERGRPSLQSTKIKWFTGCSCAAFNQVSSFTEGRCYYILFVTLILLCISLYTLVAKSPGKVKLNCRPLSLNNVVFLGEVHLVIKHFTCPIKLSVSWAKQHCPRRIRDACKVQGWNVDRIVFFKSLKNFWGLL